MGLIAPRRTCEEKKRRRDRFSLGVLFSLSLSSPFFLPCISLFSLLVSTLFLSSLSSYLLRHLLRGEPEIEHPIAEYGSDLFGLHNELAPVQQLCVARRIVLRERERREDPCKRSVSSEGYFFSLFY